MNLTHEYGVVSYHQTRDVCGKVQCFFLFGRTRLAPVKTVSIPRLELTVDTLAAKIDGMLKFELTYKTLQLFAGQIPQQFCTCSTTPPNDYQHL